MIDTIRAERLPQGRLYLNARMLTDRLQLGPACYTERKTQSKLPFPAPKPQPFRLPPRAPRHFLRLHPFPFPQPYLSLRRLNHAPPLLPPRILAQTHRRGTIRHRRSHILPGIILAIRIPIHTHRVNLLVVGAEIDLDGVVFGIESDAFVAWEADLVAGVGAGAVLVEEGVDVGGSGEDGGGGGGEEGAEEEGRRTHCVK